MELVRRSVGDPVWVYAPGHKGEKTKGKVVNVFNLDYGEYYVVEIETHVDPVLLVYDPITVSDAEDKPIGFDRGRIAIR
jgi:hypothetical protein